VPDGHAFEFSSGNIPGSRAGGFARARVAFSVEKTSGGNMSRSIALAVIVCTVLWAVHAKTSSLDVIVEMRPPVDVGPAELFFAFGEQGFHPRRSHTFRPDKQRAFSWRYGGGRALSRIRIDPMGGSGEVSVASVHLAGPAGELVLEGVILLEGIESFNQMRVISVEADQLHLLAEGDDPYFVLRVPPELYRAVTPWRIMFWGLLSLLAGGTWWWIERRLSPGMRSPLLMLVVCSSVTVVGMLYISERPIIGDGVDNLSYALNLANEGVFSHQAGDELQSTYRREVLPPFVTATYLKLFFSSDQRAEINFQWLYAEKVKYVNLAWLFLALVALWRLSFRLSGSDSFAGFMVVVAAFLLFYERNILDNLYTELPAAALLLLGSYFFLRSTQDARPLRSAGLAGLTLGLLALTKSVFFYVAPVAMVLLALVIWVAPAVRGGSGRRAGGFLLMAALGYTMVVLPWVLRNHFLLDTTDPSGRSGIIYNRAVLNQMSQEEIFGHLFFMAPHFTTVWLQVLPCPNSPEIFSAAADGSVSIVVPRTSWLMT
jgi:hypothetical protein